MTNKNVQVIKYKKEKELQYSTVSKESHSQSHHTDKLELLGY